MSWWMKIILTEDEETPKTLAACELPGGEDDAGLMESDLILMFNTLIEEAHPDLTKGEIRKCFEKAFGKVVVLGHALGTIKKGKGK